MSSPALVIRVAETDEDLTAWNRVRRIVVPDEPVTTVEWLRAAAEPGRRLLLAEWDAELAGSGLASDSSLADGFVAPRIVPGFRRRGIGTAMLGLLLDHHREMGHRSVAAHVDDDGSMAFASAHGFVEVDRQLELVRAVAPDEPEPEPFPGVAFSSVAEDPELLPQAFPIAEQGYADLVLTTGPARITLEEWLRDEATLPGGSVVAFAGGQVVGYAGLIAWNDDDARAENGLTVVDRAWRGRGLAAAMKRRQLAWAAAHGIREITSWTQQGNDAMQHINVGLGYYPRSITRTVRRDAI
jgi:GNAT superfamily N-acetyltransferase